jgi:hypothetical protein
MDPSSNAYLIAMRDNNVQAMVRTFLIQLGMLVEDYDAADSVFGAEVVKFIKSWETDLDEAV